jgi:hypothetical protein
MHMLLDHTDLARDLGNMFAGCSSIEYDTCHGQVMLQGDKFTIHEYGVDGKAAGGVELLCVLGRKHQFLRKRLRLAMCSVVVNLM